MDDTRSLEHQQQEPQQFEQTQPIQSQESGDNEEPSVTAESEAAEATEAAEAAEAEAEAAAVAQVVEVTETVETLPRPELDQPSQDTSSEIPSKRFLPNDAEHANGEFSQSSVQTSSQVLPSQESMVDPESASFCSKRRRVSMPGKSILKSSSQDDTGDTGNQETADDLATGSGNALASDVTESFSSTIDLMKRASKPISRRVSFAATARIRMFERDDKENEFPKTMSYLEGNPKVALSTPFIFESGDGDNTNETIDSTGSGSTGQDSMHEDSIISAGSSDSEKERSFEVNVYPSHSDSTGSTESGIALFVPTSEVDHGKTPFDDGDIDDESNGGDEYNSHFFPDPSLMQRSSGVCIFEGDNDSVLGPRINLIHQSGEEHLASQIMNQDDDTQDFSMEYRFQGHRSSLPERLPAPLLPPPQHEEAQDVISDFMDSAQGDANGIEATLAGNATLVHEDIHLNSLLDFRHSSNLLSQGDIMNEQVELAMTDLTDDFTRDDRSAVDEDTDMDITTPIGGIHDLTQTQDLVNELPPTAFHSAQDNTIVFSDFGSPMDMTQPIGIGILDQHTFRPTSLPTTPVQSTRSPLLFNIIDDQSSEHRPQSENEAEKSNHSQGESSQTKSDNPSPPSTPPRRQRGASFHGTEAPPLSFPRRSLGAPGQFTPSVKARLNIFSEVLEKQLQTLESSAPSEPVFRASHVSPETSNLAKRLYRYSIGTYSRASGNFQERLSRASEDGDNTMDMSLESRSISDAVPSNAAVVNNDLSGINDLSVINGANGRPEYPERAKGHRIQEQQQRETNDDIHVAGEDEDSFTELPPITLSKFLSLVGISFLDHLNASTRRRTIPHRAKTNDDSAAVYRIEDLVKAMAVSTPELSSYHEACQLLKLSMDQSRVFIDSEEKRVSKKNPDYFREFRESDVDTKEFMKDRFKMIKLHSKLEANAKFNGWKADVLKMQQTSLEQHLHELKKEIGKVAPRCRELKRQVEEATERQRNYELCDKEQLANLAEAAEEQGGQIENYESIKAEKAKELAELRTRVQKLRLTEQANKTRITAAEKTIQDHQYAGTLLEFVFDKTLKVVIDIVKIGKTSDAIQVTELEEEGDVEGTMGFDLFSADRRRLTISALSPKKRKDIKEFLGVLSDYTGMITSKYKPETTIGKILNDISQFWSKICLIRREVELVRAHHVVDLVAGSAENLKELENSNNSTKQVAGSTPLVVLDIRVRFTGAKRRVQNGKQVSKKDNEESDAEPVKFYLWFTFTLNDLLTFPGPNSFTWRLEPVYGNISREDVARTIGPVTKKGGYEILREICNMVNQILRT
ncbi:hypothetical protein BGZ65_001588 [Modicella reniformis]|uniref:Spc7 kinetochore protein domain-containing protein n=1 Tax=Modicella reniformis TaxID=1440133 RepID=A0A9P6SNJ4_9FUNG|nr:hypothetical protein BGZ65_001588 [Modicella reniformis]